MKSVIFAIRPALYIAALVIIISLEGCAVMYKVQGVDAKDPAEVKITGAEHKGKTD